MGDDGSKKEDEADCRAVTRGGFAGRLKERARGWRDHDRGRAGQRRHEAAPARPDAAATGEEWDEEVEERGEGRWYGGSYDDLPAEHAS